MYTFDYAKDCRLSPLLRALGRTLTVAFGISLGISVLIFPLVKGWPDRSPMLSGYAVILAALVLIVVSIRLWSIPGVTQALGLLSHHRFHVALFGLSLILRLLGILIFQIEPGTPGDIHHEKKAWYLVQGLGYLGDKGPDSHWPPGYVLFASIFYFFLGRNWIILAIVNCILDAITTVLVCVLARKVWDEPRARLAGLLYAINPVMIITSQLTVYAPLLGTLLITFSLLIKRNAVVLGLLLGVGALVKPIMLPGPLLVGAVDLASGASLARAAKRIAIAACLMLLTIAPWTIRNYVTFDRFFLVSSNGGWVLWLGNNPGADGRVMDWTTDLKEAEGAAFVDVNRRLGKEAMAWISDNPMKFLELVPVKQAHTWGTEAASLPRGLDRRGYTLEQIVRATTQLFYVALALAAAYALVRYSGVLVRSPEMLMACYLLALVWVIHSIFVGWSFYHKPFLPLLTAIAVGCYKRS